MSITAVEPLRSRAVGLDDAAALVSLSRRSLEREIKAGRLKTVRYGRKVLVRVEDLDGLLIRLAGAGAVAPD